MRLTKLSIAERACDEMRLADVEMSMYADAIKSSD